MAVTDTTVITGIADFLVTTLRNTITDPVTSRTSKVANSQFVLHRWSGRPLLYPCITVQITNVQSGPSLGLQTEAYYFNVTSEIEVWVKKSAYESDVLAQQVIESIKNSHYGSDSAVSNFIYNPQILSIVPIIHEEDMKQGGFEKIHRRLITVRYQYATRGV